VTRPRSLIAVAACLMTLAGCASTRTATSHKTPDATRRASTMSTAVTRRANAAASLFAAAYVRFLDGAGTAGPLPDASADVRALAGRAGSIPAARRRGTLVITQVRRAAGVEHSYLLVARDHAHTFYAQITLADRHDRSLVVGLTPPDFVQVFAPTGPPPPGPPPGSDRAEHAARVFLRGYLPWLYAQAPLAAIAAATNGLRADLNAHRPRVPPTMRSLTPKVAAVAMRRRHDGWRALANITDGHETYELVLTLTRTRAGWLVSNVSSPR
jgi:hypothetical protein